jgi:hypothetical protein
MDIMTIITITARRLGLLLAGTAGAAIVLAPIAGADTDPLVPYGTNPQVSVPVGSHTSDQDEADTSNGRVDLPF